MERKVGCRPSDLQETLAHHCPDPGIGLSQGTPPIAPHTPGTIGSDRAGAAEQRKLTDGLADRLNSWATPLLSGLARGRERRSID
jgi:hypothetical protein